MYFSDTTATRGCLFYFLKLETPYMTGHSCRFPATSAEFSLAFMKHNFMRALLNGNTKLCFIKTADRLQYSAFSAKKELA